MELEIKDTTGSKHFWFLFVSTPVDQKGRSSLYDQRDYFNFIIINTPF